MPDLPPLLPDLLPGLTAVTGGERSGKTSLLRRLSGDLPARPGEACALDARWLDLSLPAHDQQTPQQLWQAWQDQSPDWSGQLHQALLEALQLTAHQHKPLYMLSAGSRRKVALVCLLACGAKVTCLDQPYAALDMASIRVLRSLLQEMADHPSRSWVVADYEADASLPWRQVITLV